MEQAAKLKILQTLIQIPTVNQNETVVADYLASLFAPYGNRATVQKIPYDHQRDNLVITIGPHNGRPFAMSGHMDVVAPGDREQWSADPFAATIQDHKVWGRGAADMKSGLAAEVIAMLEILETNQPLKFPIRLLATVGEETGEYGAAQLTHQGVADDLLGLVIAEPTKNMQELIYTARGVIDYQVTANGKNAHSSHPELGINAIEHLLAFYREATRQLSQFTDSDPVLGQMTHVITQINGGEQANMIPGHATYSGNIRTIPNYSNQLVINTLNRLIDQFNQQTDFDLQIRYQYPETPIVGHKDAPLVQHAANVYTTIFDHAPRLTGSSEASDGSEFIQAQGDFDCIICGPGSYTSHQPNEYVEIDTYLRAIEFYKQLALVFTQA